MKSDSPRSGSLPSRGIMRTSDVRAVKTSDAEKTGSPQNWDPCHLEKKVAYLITLLWAQCLYPHPDSVLKPNPQHDGIWSWDFSGRWLDQEGSTLPNGISVHERETTESSFTPATTWGHRFGYKSGREPHPQTPNPLLGLLSLQNCKK